MVRVGGGDITAGIYLRKNKSVWWSKTENIEVRRKGASGDARVNSER